MLSMHLGVMPIVSPVGGLPRYQPPVFPPIAVDDVAGLTARSMSCQIRSPATLRVQRRRVITRIRSPWIAPPTGLSTVLTDVRRGIGKASV